MELINTKIVSERLLLVPITKKYVQVVFDNFDETITKYMYPKSPENIQQTIEWVTDSIEKMEKNKNLQLVILLKENNEFIGCIGLHNIGSASPELGVWIKRLSHGNRFGFEAVSSLIKWANKNIEFDYLKYPVDKRNIASRKIPEKNNGIIKNEYKKINQSGNQLDEVEYWIYKREEV